MPGLEDLYREIILDHYRNPRNRGELPVPAGAPQSRGSTRCAATRCRCTSTSTDGTVTDMRVTGQGCSISQSSASMMSQAVKGKSVDEARQHGAGLQGDDVDPRARARRRRRRRRRGALDDVKLGDLEALRGVVKFPVRIKCATLAWNTLTQGLDEAEADEARAS